MKSRILVLLTSALLFSGSAFADIAATQWQISAVGGEFSYAGGSAPLIATNIPVLNVEGLNTSNHAGVSLTIDNGLLNFTSGDNTGSWKWGAGGELSVYGCINGITGSGTGNSCQSGDNTLLVDDLFTSVRVVSEDYGLGVELGGITGQINSAVAGYFGISNIFTAPLSKVSDQLSGLPSTGGVDGDGVGTSFAGVTSNSPGGNLFLAAATVPENWGVFSSIGFVGLGLVVLGAARRRCSIK